MLRSRPPSSQEGGRGLQRLPLGLGPGAVLPLVRRLSSGLSYANARALAIITIVFVYQLD